MYPPVRIGNAGNDAFGVLSLLRSSADQSRSLLLLSRCDVRPNTLQQQGGNLRFGFQITETDIQTSVLQDGTGAKVVTPRFWTRPAPL